MQLLYLLPGIAFFILLKIRKYKFEVNDLIHIIFLGYLTVYFALIFDKIVSLFLPNVDFLINSRDIVSIFLIAGLAEELSKFIAIKLSKPKTKSSIFVNSILISLLFTVIEDFGYFHSYEGDALFARLLTPMHLLFQVVMAFFLQKALFAKNQGKKEQNILFQVLALVVPIILHTLFDTFTGIVIPRWFSYIIGVCTYVFIGYYLFKHILVTEVENKKISVFSIIKIVFVILSTLFFLFAFNPSSKYTSVNTELKIEEEHISITVLGSDEHEIKDDTFNFYNGTYTRVKVKIKNLASKKYEVSSLAYYLLDGKEMVTDAFISADDGFPSTIEANAEAEGYLYFKVPYKADYVFTYSPVTLDSSGNRPVYYFNIK